MRERPVNPQLQTKQKQIKDASSDKTQPNDEQYKKDDGPANKKTKPNDYQTEDTGNGWSRDNGRTNWTSSEWKDGGNGRTNWTGNGWKESDSSSGAGRNQWNKGSWKSGGNGYNSGWRNNFHAKGDRNHTNNAGERSGHNDGKNSWKRPPTPTTTSDVKGADHLGYYETLGVDVWCSEATVLKAFRELCRKCHPDKQSTDTADSVKKSMTAIFTKACAAKDVLEDSAARENYDQMCWGAGNKPTAPKPATPTLPDGWEEVLSRSTGKIYFFCRRTGQSTIDRPAAPV